jgi:hypothetical protein
MSKNELLKSTKGMALALDKTDTQQLIAEYLKNHLVKKFPAGQPKAPPPEYKEQTYYVNGKQITKVAKGCLPKFPG